MPGRFYSKAVLCCGELRAILDGGPDGGMCPPTGPCRGFSGDCADLAAPFADVAVLPDYPDGLSSYTCTAFPNDDNPVDSFIVGLIAVAIAVPVVYFMGGCFEVSIDSEVPEALLTWAGWRKLAFGFAAHRRWHYGRDGQPARYVRWWIRSSGESVLDTGANLARAAAAAAACAEPPWVREAREAEAAAEQPAAEAAEAATPRGSVSSTVRSARRLTRYKRAVKCVGLLATYCIWALFTWFIMVRDGCAAAASWHAALIRAYVPLRPRTYGSLISRRMVRSPAALRWLRRLHMRLAAARARRLASPPLTHARRVLASSPRRAPRPRTASQSHGASRGA